MGFDLLSPSISAGSEARLCKGDWVLKDGRAELHPQQGRVQSELDTAKIQVYGENALRYPERYTRPCLECMLSLLAYA